VGHQTLIQVGDQRVKTLADILPSRGPMRMLIVAKTPALSSVEVGHYFQGRHGSMLWNRLRDYGLLDVMAGTYEDDALLAHGYGITDVAKVPRNFGNEPTAEEYTAGSARILELIARLEPTVLMFVYKKVLDEMLRLSFDRPGKSNYGFNPDLDDLFGSVLFVFPMPGTPCTRAEAVKAMSGLADRLAGRRVS